MSDQDFRPTGNDRAISGPLHLLDAMLDREGNVYGHGQMSLTHGTADIFEGLTTDLIGIRFNGPNSMEFAPCRAKRHHVTGYLVPKVVGPRVQWPEELSLILSRALGGLDQSAPLTFALNSDGRLVTMKGATESVQGLSDWQGSVTDVDGVYVLTISTALRSLLPIKYSLPRQDVLLGEGDTPPRLVIKFSIDAMTRVLRFGASSPTLCRKRSTEPARVERTSLDQMRLSSTPIGSGGTLFGITDDGRWVSLFESHSEANRTICISGPVVERHRHESGLIEPDNEWPRVWLNGVDLDVIAASIGVSPMFGLTMTTGDIGSVDWSRGDPREPTPENRLFEAKLNFELTTTGLVFRYSVLPEATGQYGYPLPERRPAEKWFHGNFTLPWEVLIIRLPQLLRRRNAGEGPAWWMERGVLKHR